MTQATRNTFSSRVRSAIRTRSTLSVQTRDTDGRFSISILFTPIAIQGNSVRAKVGRSRREFGLNAVVVRSLRFAN